MRTPLTVRFPASTAFAIARRSASSSAASFLLAMILSVVFISINLEKGSAMKDNNPRNSGGSTELLHKGLTVPTMQQVQRPPAPPASGQTAPAPAPASTPASK